MSESLNFKLKVEEETMNELYTPPLNAKLNDSGYFTFDETPSLTRNRLPLIPNSLQFLTPNVTSFPPPNKFAKDDFAATPLSRPELGVPRFYLPSHEDTDQESVQKRYPQKRFETEINSALAVVTCHPYEKEGCRHGEAAFNVPPKKSSMAVMPVPGQEIGETHIDFFKELVSSYNCPIIVNRILSYLTARDLCSVCCVSKRWRQACMSDSLSNAARVKEVEKLKKKFQNLEKENELHSKLEAVLSTNYTRGPFGKNLANVNMGMKCHTQYNDSVTSTGPVVPSRFQRFQEEAKKLLPCERLQPCPRCTYPSRVDPYQKRGLCSRAVCAYDFCINCSCQYHDSLPCPVLCKSKFSKKDLIGTKSSRRNLKRL